MRLRRDHDAADNHEVGSVVSARDAKPLAEHYNKAEASGFVQRKGLLAKFVLMISMTFIRTSH